MTASMPSLSLERMMCWDQRRHFHNLRHISPFLIMSFTIILSLIISFGHSQRREINELNEQEIADLRAAFQRVYDSGEFVRIAIDHDLHCPHGDDRFLRMSSHRHISCSQTHRRGVYSSLKPFLYASMYVQLGIEGLWSVWKPP